MDGVNADCCLSDAGTAVVMSLLTTGSSGDFSSKELSSSSGVDFSSTLLSFCSSFLPALPSSCSSTWSSLAGAEVVVI